MSVADMARALATHCEAKKDKLRQTQSGDWALGFTVAKGDLPAVVRDASPGQRFMLALVPMDDDEMPLGGEDDPVAADIHPADSDAAPAAAAPTSSDKPRRRWSELSRREQAGIRCQETHFQFWLADLHGVELVSKMPSVREEWTIDAVRSHCGALRRKFDSNKDAGEKWDSLDSRYMQATGRMAVDR